MTVKAFTPVPNLNLVAPLPHKGTAMHVADTADHGQARSGAVSQVIGQASHPHTDTAKVAKALLKRDHCVKSDLSKIYRKTA